MPARNRFFSPKVGLVVSGVLALALAIATPFVPDIAVSATDVPDWHAFLEYFVAYLGICLFFICLRRFHFQRTKDFLFWGLGFLTLVIFQVFQNLAFPGFHDVWWFPTSINASLAYDLAGRLFFAIYFLMGILNINKRLLQPSRRNIILIYSNALALALFIIVCFANFFPELFYIGTQANSVKRVLDLLTAAGMLAAAGFLVRRFWSESQTIYFWFIVASVLGFFTSLHLSLWGALFDQHFLAGHALKILFLTSFLIGVLAEHLRFFKIEAELRQSLEKSREDLEKSEQTFRELVENMADGFVVTDEFGILIFCNRAFAQMLDDKPENLINRHFSELFYGSHYQKMNLEALHRQAGSGTKFEVELMTRSGEKRPAMLHATAISEANDRKAGIQAVVTNLTELKKIEKNLESLVKEKTQSVAIFKQCIENATDGILIVSANGNISYLNRAFEKISGFSKAELVRQKTSVLISGKESENTHQRMWKVARSGSIWRGDFYTKKKDNGSFLGDVAFIPITDDRDRIINYLWIEKDVTRQKTLEKTLENYADALTERSDELDATRSYYQTLISGISDILVVVDNAGHCTFLNDYGAKRLRFEAEELTKENLPVFFDDLKRLEKEYGSSLRVEIKDFESPILTKSGETVLCSWHARPLIDKDGHRIGAMAVGRDITEFKRMQKEIREYTRNLENKVKNRTEELQQKVNQLGRLLEIGEEIRLNFDVDLILNKICDAVQALGWKKVVISLRDYETRTSKVVAAAGLKAELIEEVMSWGDIPFEHTQKYLNEEFRISNSFLVDHRAKAIKRDAPYSIYTELGDREKDEWHSLDALLVPIRTMDRILGIISVDDPVDRKRPDISKVRDLELFADKAAMAIENARLFQMQKENEQQAKFLAEISQIFHSSLKMNEVLEAIVTKGAKGIGEFCSLLLVDDTGEYLAPEASYHEDSKVVNTFLKGFEKSRPRVGRGIVGEVMATSKAWMKSKPFPAEITEFAETQFYELNQKYPVASIILAPLLVRGQKIGVMVFMTFDVKKKFKMRDFKLAQELAQRAGLAIENARLFREAGEKARELEKANKLKTEFLANVSHELRTPLNAIITLSDILIREIPGRLNEEQIKQLQIIQKSGRNLLHLINDILDLSKIEAGRIEPSYSNVPIRAVIEETVEHIRPLCMEKGLDLEFLCSENVPDVVWSDQDKITKAVTNLLSNAVKFTSSGSVKLTMHMQGKNQLIITVSDTGIGIPEDRIDEIFKEFHQIDGTDSKKYGGTGLGLAITRKMMDILGGAVAVESELNKGSVFKLQIPLQPKKLQLREPPAQYVRSIPDSSSEDIDLEMIDDREHLEPDKKTILVIDDEKEAIYIMLQYLHQHDFQVIFPRNGENVFELAKQYQPLAVTLDLLMPDQSGWDVLEILKGSPETEEIPVVITSILPEEEKALQRGASGYLMKPFEPQKLVAILSNLETRPRKRKPGLDLPKFLSLKNLSGKKLFDFARKDPDNGNGKARVLLVDDDKDTRYAIQFVLEEAGYEVHMASEGREAIEKAHNIHPELILMDMMMPGMDGYEATQQLKSEQELKGIPIIAITAKAMKGDREEILAVGCNDYISKPFMSDEVLSLVEKWLHQGPALENQHES